MNMRGLYRCRAFCFDVMRRDASGRFAALDPVLPAREKSGPNE
jgi:hypothetical protein